MVHLLPSTTTGGFPSSVVVVVDRNMIETHHQKAIECFADTLTLFEIVKSVTMIILDCFYWTSLQFVQTSLLSSTLYNAQSDALESAGEREGKSMLCCSPVRPLFGTTTALITATSAQKRRSSRRNSYSETRICSSNKCPIIQSENWPPLRAPLRNETKCSCFWNAWTRRGISLSHTSLCRTVNGLIWQATDTECDKCVWILSMRPSVISTKYVLWMQ